MVKAPIVVVAAADCAAIRPALRGWRTAREITVSGALRSFSEAAGQDFARDPTVGGSDLDQGALSINEQRPLEGVGRVDPAGDVERIDEAARRGRSLVRRGA
jgi:hypothetical protein